MLRIVTILGSILNHFCQPGLSRACSGTFSSLAGCISMALMTMLGGTSVSWRALAAFLQLLSLATRRSCRSRTPERFENPRVFVAMCCQLSVVDARGQCGHL